MGGGALIEMVKVSLCKLRLLRTMGWAVEDKLKMRGRMPRVSHGRACAAGRAVKSSITATKRAMSVVVDLLTDIFHLQKEPVEVR